MHGQQYVPLVGVNFFGDHSYFIHLFVLPFFYLFPSPITLLCLKLLAFCATAYLIYRMAEERLGGNAALGILSMYLLFPGNIFGLLYEFNPECFAPLFIVLMFRALQKKDFRRLMLWAVFLILVKENMVLIAAAFGIRALFLAGKGERKPLVLFVVASMVIFISLVFLLIPHFRGLEQHAFTARYSKLGNNVQDIMLVPFKHPVWLFKVILMPVNLKFLGNLFSYLLIPAIFSPVALLMMLPLLLQHICSSSMAEHTIYYHYAPTLIPFIFVAFLDTMSKLQQMQWAKRHVPGVVVIFFLLILGGLFSCQKAFATRWRLLPSEQSREIWQVVRDIPPDAPVMATFRFLAPLSTRSEVYAFHKLYSDEFNDTQRMAHSELKSGSAFSLPPQVGYALIDLDDPWYVQSINSGKEGELKRIKAFFDDPQWHRVKQVGKILLLQREVPRP